MSIGIAALITFFVCLIGVPIFLGLLRALGFYTVVHEGTCQVYVLFGQVIGVLDEPGLYFLWAKLGPKALIVNWLGRREVLDMRLRQRYLRSQTVNSEEGAPMGIGVWYEMVISDPVAYLFRNADPEGSLAANVGNTTVKCLSNMPLTYLLENRHMLSPLVRKEVSEQSKDWGYRLGSVYIRKVHFRDANMIRQIEAKVVNRLRQVTSAIKQDGANQVSVITSTAERQAAVEFARAAAIRPKIVGEALQKISQDPEIADTMFTIMETQRLLEKQTQVVLIPPRNELMAQFMATAALPALAPQVPGTAIAAQTGGHRPNT
jgi:regulator of protease activity HflC (stomatin/prohibitin superfamily)